MRRVILFGIGYQGRKIMEAYSKYDVDFEIVAIADNSTQKTSCFDISIIPPKKISEYEYDEIWISTVYWREIKKQLVDEWHISPSVIRYVEYPMPFLEQQIYRRYADEITGKKKCENDEKQVVIDYIARNGIRMYCYPFFDEYEKKDIQVFFEQEHGLYYGIYMGHKMFLSRKIDTPEKAANYLRYTFMEQDKRSPHCYFTDDFRIDDKERGIDIGAAEGVFALDIIDRVEHIYLIEADSDWCEALALTFAKYEDKVTIIRGFVSNSGGKGQIVLDQMFKNTQIDFIKMDIEGAEEEALSGAENLLRRCAPKLAVCTYHHAEDNSKFSKWLQEKGYSVKNSSGYVICQGEWELEHLMEVDFRRALLWAERA